MSLIALLDQIEGWDAEWNDRQKIEILYRKFTFLQTNKLLVDSGFSRRNKRALRQIDFVGNHGKYAAFASRVFRDVLKTFSADLQTFKQEFSFEGLPHVRAAVEDPENPINMDLFTIHHFRKVRMAQQFNLSMTLLEEDFYQALCRNHAQIETTQSNFYCPGLDGSLRGYGGRYWLTASIAYQSSWFFNPSKPNTTLEFIKYFQDFLEAIKRSYKTYFQALESKLSDNAAFINALEADDNSSSELQSAEAGTVAITDEDTH